MDKADRQTRETGTRTGRDKAERHVLVLDGMLRWPTLPVPAPSCPSWLPSSRGQSEASVGAEDEARDETRGVRREMRDAAEEARKMQRHLILLGGHGGTAEECSQPERSQSECMHSHMSERKQPGTPPLRPSAPQHSPRRVSSALLALNRSRHAALGRPASQSDGKR
ncbi:hypothetical protein BC831DRAFT_480458 [Entophlyctis helioformis]|nr:hypothetical protein BC831DRAFT_480458 [Entophlyctis helioformis]